MKTQLLGSSSLVSTRMAYGCMRISGTWNPSSFTAENERQGRAAVLAAVEAGYTLFDHADIYGSGTCETLFGRLLHDTPGLRDGMIIATKCGVRRAGEPTAAAPGRYDFSADWILGSCEDSLRRVRRSARPG
jgi:predicted oxidoreductase